LEVVADEAPEPSEPADLRGLVPFEVAAVLAVAAVPLPHGIPAAVPLLVFGTASRWLRRRDWSELLQPGRGRAGWSALAGLVALAIALVAGGPVVEQLTGRSVAWSAFPTVRGSPEQLALVALVLAAMAIASELALRGWIVERVLELSPGPPILPVLVGALAEALVTRGDLDVRIGAGAFGAGLGWLYVAAGRNAIAPTCARLAFGLGAACLEALRVIG
jgi:hypothetical protein